MSETPYFAINEPTKIEGTDKYEEARFHLTILACKCGEFHIIPSEKTILKQISERMNIPAIARCGPYYLYTNTYFEEMVGEPNLSDHYLIGWKTYQVKKEKFEDLKIDKTKKIQL